MPDSALTITVDASSAKASLTVAALLGPEVFNRALRGIVNDIKKDSMRRTPVKTGALRGSHEVIGPIGTYPDIGFKIQVGGSAAPYAIFVHEVLPPAVHHPNGEAKFLENAVIEGTKDIEAKMEKAIYLIKAGL